MILYKISNKDRMIEKKGDSTVIKPMFHSIMKSIEGLI